VSEGILLYDTGSVEFATPKKINTAEEKKKPNDTLTFGSQVV